MNSTLIVLDDLTDLVSSKNRYVQKGLDIYIEHIKKSLQREVLKFSGKKLVIAGPREILSQLEVDAELASFESWFDTISFDKAGASAVQMAEAIVESGTFQKICPNLFNQEIFAPKVSVTRLAISLCYNPANHYFMIQNIINKFLINEIIVLGGHSEIERIALALARSKKIQARALCSNDLIMKAKSLFLDYVYFRDRRLHLSNSFKPAMIEDARRSFVEDSRSRKMILMVPAHSLHFRMLIPLAIALNETKRFAACVLLQNGFEVFAKQLNEQGIDYRFLDDIPHSKLALLANKYKKEISQNWKKLKNLPEFKKLFWNSGIDWFDILFNKLRWFFILSLTEILLLIERLRCSMKRIDPDALVCFSDSRFFEVGSATICKELKIPSVQYSTTFLPDTDAINQYDTCDYVLTVGDEMRSYIRAKNRIPSHHVVTVGDIRFDDADAWCQKEVQSETRCHLGIATGTRIFTLVSFYTGVSMGYTNFDKQRLFEMARDAIKNVSNATLVIKAHPNEKEEVLADFVRELGMSSFVITKSTSLFQLFGISSGIISLTSISCIEALACDTPVVIVNLPDRDYDYYIPFKKNHVVPCAQSAEELTKIMINLNESGTYRQEWINRGRKFLSQYIERTHGPAKDQIVSFFNKLLYSNVSDSVKREFSKQ